jgi:hypothetical protein
MFIFQKGDFTVIEFVTVTDRREIKDLKSYTIHSCWFEYVNYIQSFTDIFNELKCEKSYTTEEGTLTFEIENHL